MLLPEGGQCSWLGCRNSLVTASRVGAQGLSPARADLRWKSRSMQKQPSKPCVYSQVCNWTQQWPWLQRMSALHECFFPSPKDNKFRGCAFKCLQYITSSRSRDSNLRHGLCPEILDSFITWQLKHIKDNQRHLSSFSTILPLHPSLHKALTCQKSFQLTLHLH